MFVADRTAPTCGCRNLDRATVVLLIGAAAPLPLPDC